MSIKELVEREFVKAKRQVTAGHEKELRLLEAEIDEIGKRTLKQFENT